ncbi:MAG: terminase small subunit protein [Candidatus Thorarchaeota archaeon]
MPAGRPSDYTQDIANRLCEQLAEGVSMQRACEPDDMPCKRTVFNWLATNEPFLHQYESAKAECADHLAEQMIEIADDGTNDYMERQNSDGSTHEVVNSEHIQRSRLRIDARKWIASKLKPKKYGDKTIHAGDEDNPLRVSGTVNFIDSSNKD